MATNRLADLLRARTDFSDEEIARMTEKDAWECIRTAPYRDDAEEERSESENN